MSSLHKKVLALFIVAVLDAVLTVGLVVHGWGEANPMLNWYMHMTDVSTMAITKIVVTFLLLYIIYDKERAERHLDWAIPLYIVILFGGLVFQFAWLKIGG